MRTSAPPEDTLRQWARHLDGIREPGVAAEPFVDVMSDALVWTDETISSTPTEVIWALRFVRHYRTGLILGVARPHSEFWQLARDLFPHWVGFLPSRCELSPRLAEIYNTSRKRGKDGSHTTA